MSMNNSEPITSITFHQTANIFANVGIVAIKRYLDKFVRYDNYSKYKDLQYELSKRTLKIECSGLVDLLIELYYFMGREVYDTWTTKQLEDSSNGTNCNIYYSEEEDLFVPFPKIKSYGLPELFTNGRPKNTTDEKNQSKLSIIRNENPTLFEKYIAEFNQRNIKPGKVIYFNEPYTTIPRITIPSRDHLVEDENGKGLCSITGLSYKKLFDANNNSVFIKKQGIHNFKSFFKNSSYQVSWKAMYLIRFAPALCLYAYQNNYETLICNFFNSNNLQNLDELYETDMYRIKEELAQINYRINFRMADFKIPRKGAEDLKIETTIDAVWESEIAFMLLYTFYRKHFWKEGAETEVNVGYSNPFASHPMEDIPISLVTFRADNFSKTLRPNFYEEYNHVKFVIQLISALEGAGVPISTIWQSLKINSPKSQTVKKQDYSKGLAVERQIRSSVFEKVLTGKSIVTELEELFFKCYKLLLAREPIGFKNYTNLLNFLTIYEKATKFGNHKTMNEQLQQRAINLGRSLGKGIIYLDHPKDDNEQKANAKTGRKYIIRLHKARTLEQFTEALISLMKKYNISVSSELLENLNDKNFLLIRQYTVISALNVLNYILSPSKNND
jgi:hypothetical protein